MKPVVYTIGRQYGSGGHEIGEKLAKRLNVPFYDNELIALAAQKSGISKEIFEEVDEKPTNSFLYSLAMGAFSIGGVSGYNEVSINDRLFVAQSEVIDDVVKQGSCVFVGRCADYVLREYENTVDVFVYGSIDNRIKRIEHLLHIPRQKAIEAINKKDKVTSNFYNYYTNQKWGGSENYDLLINTDHLSIDNAVELILKYADLRFNG